MLFIHVSSQPGVWCLFEFLLAGRHNLDIDFATDVGVLGDDAWQECCCLSIASQEARHFYAKPPNSVSEMFKK